MGEKEWFMRGEVDAGAGAGVAMPQVFSRVP